jgi:hypothetical protein
MAAPLTERELLIACIAYKRAMNAVLEMARTGFNVEMTCQIAISDPNLPARLRRSIEEILARPEAEQELPSDALLLEKRRAHS